MFTTLFFALWIGWSPAHAALKDPKFKTGQQVLLCQYLLTNTVKDAAQDAFYYLMGQKNFNQRVLAAFKEHPGLWRSLVVNRANHYPSETNQLAIFNTHESMDSVCKKTKGFCWGHATMKLFLTNLLFFDPKAEFSSIPTFKEGSDEWKSFYVDLLKRAMKGEPTVVPGFAHLKEFSGHPDLIKYFKQEAVVSWASHAGRLASFPMFISQKDYTPIQSKRFVNEVKKRLEQGYTPKIIFDENDNKLVKDEKYSIHVVLALAIHPLKHNKTAIVVWDDKKPDPDALDVLILNHNSGKGFYWSWRWQTQGHGIDMGGGLINQYRIAPENDQEVRAISFRLGQFCDENPELCKKLGRSEIRPAPKPALPIPGKPWSNFEYAE